MNALCSHHFSKGKMHVPNICLQMLDQVGDPTALRCLWHCLKCCIMCLVQFLSVSILGIYKAPITLVPKQFEKCTHPRREDEIQTEAQAQSSRGRAQEAPQLCSCCCWAPGPLVVAKEHLHPPVCQQEETVPQPSRAAPLVGGLKRKDNGKGNDPVAEVKQEWWDFKRRAS